MISYLVCSFVLCLTMISYFVCRSRIAWQIGLTLQYGVLDRMDSIAYVFLQCYGLWIESGKDQIICGSLYFVMHTGYHVVSGVTSLLNL